MRVGKFFMFFFFPSSSLLPFFFSHFPCLTSQMMMPKEKQSTDSEYCSPLIISGAIQYGDPTMVMRRAQLANVRARVGADMR